MMHSVKDNYKFESISLSKRDAQNFGTGLKTGGFVTAAPVDFMIPVHCTVHISPNGLAENEWYSAPD